MENKNTYKMVYKCCNCGTTFITSVAKGKEARGRGGKCPYCDVADLAGLNHEPIIRPRWAYIDE